jgi:hypothetical protein
MTVELKAEIIKTGSINGKDYQGIIVELMPDMLMATIHEVIPVSNTTFGEHVTSNFSDWQTAKEFILSEWLKLESDKK